MKWRILLDIPMYPLHKQTEIVVACMALHNFIRDSAIADEDFDLADRNENYVPLEAGTSASRPSRNNTEPEDRNMNVFRDAIADGLFNRL